MKKLCFLWIMAGVAFLNSCEIQKPIDVPENPDYREYFDFATSQTMNVRVKYDLNVEGNYRALFSIYAENPLEMSLDSEGNLVPIGLRTDVKSLGMAMTDANGKYEGKMLLPSYLEEVYIYSASMGVPSLMVASVNNGVISSDISGNRTTATKAEPYIYNGVPAGWLTLGNWSKKGKPEYLLEREKLPVNLWADITNTLPESKHINKAHEGYVDADRNTNIHVIAEDGVELEFVFLHCGGGYTNAVGYYTYPTDTPPQDASELQHIVAFPLASYDSGLSQYSWAQKGELKSGDKVKLRYWDGTQFVDRFPKGVSVGFVMAANAFNTYESKIYARNTTNELSNLRYSNTALNMNGMQQHVAVWDSNREIVVIGIEDQNRKTQTDCDHDFNDVLFFIKIKTGDFDPGDMPTIDPDPTPNPTPNLYDEEYYGTLAFEDLWPSKGDYDMNDLVIKYEIVVTKDEDNKVVEINEKWTPLWTGANINFNNSFGIAYGKLSDYVSQVNVEAKNYSEDSWKIENNNTEELSLILFEDMNDVMGVVSGAKGKGDASWLVNMTFDTPVEMDGETVMFPPYNPYIITNVKKSSIRREVHLPYYQPTMLADGSEFGKYDDKSDPEKDIWYVSDEKYPFAINLQWVLDYQIPQEMKTIETTYPRFTNWVLSGGTTNKEWYME